VGGGDANSYPPRPKALLQTTMARIRIKGMEYGAVAK